MSVEYKDYYKTLGVERDVSPKELKKVFRKLALKFHPDVSKEPDAEERFKEVNEAYEVLNDPEKRKRYDSLGAGWEGGQGFTPPPGAQNFEFHTDGGDFDAGGFSDFFQSIFRGAGGFGGGRGSGGSRGGDSGGDPGWSRRGDDREASFEVTLEEAATGASKTTELLEREIGPGGRITTDRHVYDVHVPPGVTEGSKIRLAGQGGKGIGGAPDGDLFLRVRLKPHPRFSVDGRDLRTKVRVAPWEAALGCEVELATLDEKLSLRVAAGTQSGQTLRLRGKGLPSPQGAAGDLLARVEIVVPKTLSDRERELFETLSRESTFRARDEAK